MVMLYRCVKTNYQPGFHDTEFSIYKFDKDYVFYISEDSGKVVTFNLPDGEIEKIISILGREESGVW